MRALVTGAAGFISTVLTRELIRQGHTVKALALPQEDTRTLQELGVEVRRGNLLEPGSLRGICDGMDTVFHLAARVTDWGRRGLFYAANFDATRNLLDGIVRAGTQTSAKAKPITCATAGTSAGKPTWRPAWASGRAPACRSR